MYNIIGKYQRNAAEIIDTAETMAEARTLLAEYRMAFGTGWSLTIRKEK